MDVLLLDLDDTLVADVAARDQAFCELIEGPDLAAALLVVRQEWSRTSIRTLPAMAGVSSWEALWIDFDAAVTISEAKATGQQYQQRVWEQLLPGRGPEAAEAFQLARARLTKPYDWVTAALDEWRQSHVLWCVTNGSSWLQRRKLDLAGLTDAFDRVIASGDVGAEKVDPHYHAEVTRRLSQTGFRPVAVVGDGEHSDGALAQALEVPYCPVEPGIRPALHLTSVPVPEHRGVPASER